MKTTNSNRGAKSRGLKFEALESRRLLTADATMGEVLVDACQLNSCLELEEVASPWYQLTSSQLNPSAIEQELLEQFNRFRLDPQGEIERLFSVADSTTLVAKNPLVNAALSLTSYPSNSLDAFYEQFSSLSASAPLAFNATLESAAKSHSSFMKSRNDISHQCTGEADLNSRVQKAGFVAGYDGSGTISVSENIGGGYVEKNGWSVASYMEAAFVVDWGVPSHQHRDSITNSAYSEVGISVQQTNKSIGPYIVTCDFGSSMDGARADGAYLLGVVFDDQDGDRFYDVGEGLGLMDLQIERLDGSDTPESITIKSWTAGGYQIFLLNGNYRITVSGDSFSTSITKTVTISNGVNVKLDFLANDASVSAPVVDLNGDADGNDWTIEYVEGSEEPLEIFSTGSVSIIDVDSAYLYGAKIYFSSRPDESNETLDVSISGTNLNATFDKQSGFITIDGEGSLEEYENVIASLEYFNSAELCNLSERSIVISVFDGNNWSADSTLDISIKATKFPSLTVHEMVAYEGDEGTKTVFFVAELDSPARLDVTFNFNVAVGGTAIEGENFVISKGDPIVIASGETCAKIDCYVIGNFDALQPEGVKRVEDGYENPFSDFYLEIVDVKNAYLTNEASLAKGTIFDDDSPIVLGKTDEYAFKDVLTTDFGQRRYNFTLTPTASGLFTWSADSLGLTQDVHITVREGSIDADILAESNSTKQGGNVQWYADPSVEYWITVESSEDFTSLAAKLLALTDEKLVLVDPLFDDSDTTLLSLMWTADGNLELDVNGLFWDLDAQYWQGASFKTDRNDLNLALSAPAFSTGSITSNDDNSSVISFDDQDGITTTGFASFDFLGAGENENLSFSGTEGNDYLYYSDGFGYFQCANGKTYSFTGINSVNIDGVGGADRAYIEDSRSNDRLETSNNSISLYGGGYALTAKRFTDVRVIFNHGGEDVYYATDDGDDVCATISKNATIMEGSFEDVIETSDSSYSQPVTNSANVLKRQYVRTVSGAEHTVLAPAETISSVVLFGDNSVSSYLNVGVGNLSTYNKRADTSLEVNRVKSLVVKGVNPLNSDRMTVGLPATYQTQTVDDYTIITDADSEWSITIPNWKALASSSTIASNACLDDKGNEQTSKYNIMSKEDNDSGSGVMSNDYLDGVFAEWNGTDLVEFGIQTLDLASLSNDCDVFDLIRSIQNNDKSSLKRLGSRNR